MESINFVFSGLTPTVYNEYVVNSYWWDYETKLLESVSFVIDYKDIEIG